MAERAVEAKQPFLQWILRVLERIRPPPGLRLKGRYSAAALVATLGNLRAMPGALP